MDLWFAGSAHGVPTDVRKALNFRIVLRKSEKIVRSLKKGGICRKIANVESTAQQLALVIESASQVRVKFIHTMTEHHELLSQSLGIPKKMKQERATNSENTAIDLWSFLANEENLIWTIPTGSRGKHWSRILLFVGSVCGLMHGKFSLKDMSANEVKAEWNTYIFPGDYVLEPVDGYAELDMSQ
jgi:hypothetical protein